jgi:Flp pilus assembly protein protease CpaA
MNEFTSIILGVAGVIIGYKIPEISLNVMEYKKGNGNIQKYDTFLYSKLFTFLMCIVNGIIWYISSIGASNIFVSILISIQITIGLIIAYIDINIKIIPNELVLILSILGIIFQIATNGYKILISAVICMLAMMAVFTSAAGFVGFGKVGAGDVKLAGVMGLALGYPLIITAIFIMAIVLLIFIVCGLLIKKISLATMLPLAPFMISGYIAAFVSLII